MSSLATTPFSAARQRLRISIVTETYPPEVNGVAITLEQMVNGLLDRGHHIQLIRPRQNRTDLPRRKGNLEEIPQPGMAIPFYPELRMGLPVGYRLARRWRHAAPDVVHIATEGLLGYSALCASRRLRLPVSSSFHTNFHSYSRHYGVGVLATPIAAYLRRFHNRTAFTLVPTQELAEHLQSAGFTTLRVLQRGVDTRVFSPARRSPLLRERWGASPEDPVLLYVGRLAAEKNLELAIAAFETAQQRCPAARFVLVGDGPVAATLQARYPHFIFAGLRRGEDLAEHYASADIFVFPSLTETFGNVILEAMASGLAVVAFDYAAARQHIEHNRSGLPVPYQDNQAFVAAVQSLIEQPNQRRELGKEASRAAQRWDWQRVHDQLEAIFLELAHSGSDHG